MVVCIAAKPFKDREEVKKLISICDMWNNISGGLAFVFALIGVIGDAIDKTLGLETMTWLLLGVIFAVISLTPMINLAAMRHLYGIESEKK